MEKEPALTTSGEALANKEKERAELSPEQLEIVMKKVDDIDTYGTAFTWIGMQEHDLGIGQENSKFRKILKDGVIGVSPDRPGVDRSNWGIPNSAEEYAKDLKEKREKPPEVFFNIVGRWGSPYKGSGGIPKTIENIPIYGRSRNPILITFSIDKFSEKNVKEGSGKNGDNQPTEKGTFTVHNYGRNFPIPYPNERGDEHADSDYGFKLAGRIQPRTFKGIVFRKSREIEENNFEALGINLRDGADWYFDDQQRKWNVDESTGKKVLFIEETDPEVLRLYAEEIAHDLLLINEGKDQNLIPIYDTRGNLWWPKQISHEEIAQMGT